MTNQPEEHTPTNEAPAAVAELTPTEVSAAKPAKGRGRRILASAALVTAGLVAGSGATYAITTQTVPTQTQFSNPQGGPRGAGGGELGVPPSGAGPEAQQQDQQAPSTDGTQPG